MSNIEKSEQQPRIEVITCRTCSGDQEVACTCCDGPHVPGQTEWDVGVSNPLCALCGGTGTVICTTCNGGGTETIITYD